MIFAPLGFDGVFGISTSLFEDDRGSLIRVWEEESLLQSFNLRQASFVANPAERTLRGLHYQKGSFTERKLIICLTGKVFDVAVDLRAGSKTYGQHIELSLGRDCKFQGILIPAEFAHGYLTLEKDSNLLYFMDELYSHENAVGINWKSPALGINWPFSPVLISERDQNWPLDLS